VVDLSYNKLTYLREGLLEQALCAVRRLSLSNNQIDRLPRYMLEHLPYLAHLDLADNALTWLDVGAFTNPSLSVVDLSGNRLRKIVSMTFLYLPALRSVDLARNEISYVYKFAFYRMCSDARTPIAVSLRANRLDCEPGNAVARFIRMLYIVSVVFVYNLLMSKAAHLSVSCFWYSVKRIPAVFHRHFGKRSTFSVTFSRII